MLNASQEEKHRHRKPAGQPESYMAFVYRALIQHLDTELLYLPSQ